MKGPSKQWTTSNKEILKKAKAIPLARKVMATVFWDSKGIILVDYLENEKMITRQYYADLLCSFNAKLKEKQAICPVAENGALS